MSKTTVVPASKSTEYAIISLMIRHDDNRILLSDITQEHFSEANCLNTFNAIKTLEKSNTRIDTTTIYDLLSKNEKNSITQENLEMLKSYSCHSDNINTYKEVLEQKRLERQLYNVSYSIKEISFKDIPYEEKVSQAIGAITSMNYSIGEQTITHTTAKKRLIAEIIATQNRKGACLTWGIESLDDALGGLFPDLYVIGGMTAGGKTAFMVNMIGANIDNGHKCLFFSAEMTAEMIMYREINNKLGISSTRLRNGMINDYEMTLIEEYQTNDNLLLNDTANIDIDKLVTTAILEHKKHGLSAIFVDYLQLLSTSKYKDQEVQKIGYISGQLKALSHKLNIPVIALVQYNKEVEGKDKPSKNNIYGSGKIVKDSGAVILIHREDYFDKEIAKNKSHAKNGLVEFIIDKSRYSEIKSVYGKWIPEKTSFTDLPANFKLPSNEVVSTKKGFFKAKTKPQFWVENTDNEVPLFPAEDN